MLENVHVDGGTEITEEAFKAKIKSLLLTMIDNGQIANVPRKQIESANKWRRLGLFAKIKGLKPRFYWQTDAVSGKPSITIQFK